ncbi:hypothetical protein NMY22_g19796 [Coprinellus aureogranulatus]|nr:hypothetical protein NMY22_g19796 [Coprinellus aureogranulatus]
MSNVAQAQDNVLNVPAADNAPVLVPPHGPAPPQVVDVDDDGEVADDALPTIRTSLLEEIRAIGEGLSTPLPDHGQQRMHL